MSMSEKQSRYCTKAGCSLHNVTVDTDKKKCIACGTELRLDFVADIQRTINDSFKDFRR